MSGRRGWRWSTRSERMEIRRRVAGGERVDDVAMGVGRSKRFVQVIVSPFGGIQPRPTVRSTLRLSNAERGDLPRPARGRVAAPDRGEARSPAVDRVARGG